jgi:putative nucleotidyltransferase with HDIG domain
VEIPQQGDVDTMGKTDATTRRASEGRLPDSKIACDGSDRTERDEKADNAGKHLLLPEGTDGVIEDITLKGDFQRRPRARLSTFLGFVERATLQDWALAIYTVCLGASFVSVVALLLANGSYRPMFGAWWPLSALAASALLAERQSVRLGPRAEISVSFVPVVLAAVIYGPLAAVLVSGASLILDFGRPHARWVVWMSSRSLAAAAAGVAATSLDGPSGVHTLARVVAAVAVAMLVDQSTDLALGCVTAAVRGVPVREIARLGYNLSFAVPLYTPLTAVLVYAYREISPWSVLLFLFPAFAAQKLFLLYQEQRATSEQLSAAVARQEKAYISFASALVATLDARDCYTAGHSAAVAIYARDIAERLGLSERDQKLAHLCGLVHDIGKIGLPAGLLEKTGALTLAERRQMETHTEIGERILVKVDDYEEVARIVRHHHERVDGTGYPDCLTGDEIPLLSRIISVADAYNAMTSDRPYREAMPSQVARLRMAQAVETQFDTSVVAAFEAVLAGASESYRAGSQSEFDFSKEKNQHLKPLAVAS